MPEAQQRLGWQKPRKPLSFIDAMKGGLQEKEKRLT